MTFEQVVLTTKPSKPTDIGSGRFGAQLVSFPPTQFKAVVKAAIFETKRIRGVPKPEMHRREVAVYRLDRDVLKLNVVPPVLLARFKGLESSVSQYIDGLLPRQLVPHLFQDDEGKSERLARFFAKVSIEDAAKIVLLDLVINNADRHGLNVLVQPRHHGLVAIDNGMSFGRAFRYYRNVIHRYAFLHNFPFDMKIRARFSAIKKHQVGAALHGLVSQREVDETWARLQFVLQHADHLDFHTLSKGEYGKNDFPSYREWFDKRPEAKSSTALILAFTGS
jgi:hypothetical protein